jgi:hypothetical protein
MVRDMNEGLLFPPTKDELLIGILKQYQLPEGILPQLKQYLDGSIPESSLVCCQSGCDICSESIYIALQKSKEVLARSECLES